MKNIILNQRAERDELMARPYQQRNTRYNSDDIPAKTLFYYRTRNDKEIDFVTRNGSKVEQLIQVCYDMSSEKTRKPSSVYF